MRFHGDGSGEVEGLRFRLEVARRVGGVRVQGGGVSDSHGARPVY